jgi:hypothetical protein
MYGQISTLSYASENLCSCLSILYYFKSMLVIFVQDFLFSATIQRPAPDRTPQMLFGLLARFLQAGAPMHSPTHLHDIPIMAVLFVPNRYGLTCFSDPSSQAPAFRA